MPGMQVALGFLNKMFGDPEYLRRDRVNLLNLFRPGQTVNEMVGVANEILSGALEGGSVVGADPTKIANLLKGEPPTIIEAQRAVVQRNLEREEPFGMTFAWAPAYDWELTVWESPPTDISPGWITVLIRGRYPSDQQPVTGKDMDKKWG
ncbi:MAG: hypothetical protein QOC79_2766 [Actinomycetota bacterium]|jgi:hypothetical protein|nr:hypothetical protein [Actinomycetota bacterium]MDQ1457786.1 hypothetical protein [Actinomycetota bacterium]